MSLDHSRAATVLDQFKLIVDDQGDRVLYTDVRADGRDGSSLTATQLHRAALSIADALRFDHGLEPGDRVLLLYPQTVEVVKAFLACLYAGLVPAPVAPPNPFAPMDDLETLAALASDCGARALLTERSYHNATRMGKLKTLLSRRRARWPDLPWIRTDGVRPGPTVLRPSTPSPTQLAYLQYTSGSTSTPKGVCVCFANIAHQMQLQRLCFGVDANTVGVLWTPYFHDLSLVAGVLSGLAGNGHLYLVSPLDFLRRPALWMEVMSRVGATHTAAPDFAYRLVVRKTTPAQRSAWDLSTVRCFGAGGEPNRVDTIAEFLDAFAVSRVEPSAYCPTYGIAEHTLFVTQSPAGAPHRELGVDRRALEEERQVRVSDSPEATRLVGCGRAVGGVEVAAVEDGVRVGDDRVGELWIASPSRALGYFARSELSAEIFEARLAGDDRTWLRTGDLGFVHEQEVYLTGRVKDLIVVRGRNIYPQDLEATVQEVAPELRPGRVVAFAVEVDGQDAPVLAAELRADVSTDVLRRLDIGVREAMLRRHQVHLHAVVLCAANALAKTSSGKVRRGATREAWLEGRLLDLRPGS